MDIEIKTEDEVPKVRGRKPSTAPRRRVKHALPPPEEPIEFVAPSLVQRPSTSSSTLYRRIALGFSLVSLLALGGILAMATQEATITVKATRQPISTTLSVNIQNTVSKKAAAPSGASVPVLNGTVATISHTAEQAFKASLGEVAGGTSSGMVSIINNFSKNQPLVARTRLLSKEGVLFRIAKGVTVPAKGSVQVAVYADKEGPTGDISPSTFTIPGLWTGLQDKIYAKSETAMQGVASKHPYFCR